MLRVMLDRLYLFAGFAAGGFMLAIFVLMMALSAGRPVGLNIPAADDFVSWCMAAMAFLGLAILFIAFVDELIHVLMGNLPRYEKPKPQTADEVVERAVQSGV